MLLYQSRVTKILSVLLALVITISTLPTGSEYYLRVSNGGKEEYISYSEYVEFVINHVAYINFHNYGNGIIHIREV